VRILKEWMPREKGGGFSWFWGISEQRPRAKGREEDEAWKANIYNRGTLEIT